MSKVTRKPFFSSGKSSKSFDGRPNEKTSPGRATADMPTLYPTSGKQTTNYLKFIQAWLPYIGKETSVRVEEALVKGKFKKAKVELLTKEQEEKLSKTEIANLIDTNKCNKLQNQTDMDSMKIAFTLLVGNISSQSIDVLKQRYLQSDLNEDGTEKRPSQTWDTVLAEKDALLLLSFIKQTHLASIQGVLAIRTVEYVRMLFSLQAHTSESISEFHSRLVSVSEGAALYDLSFNQELLAAIMFLGLPNEYAAMKKDVVNADAIGSAVFPTTCVEIENLAAEWVADVSTKSGDILISVQDSSTQRAIDDKAKEKAKKAAAKLAKEKEAAKAKAKELAAAKVTSQQQGKIELPTGTPPKPCDCGEHHYSWTCPEKTEDEKNAISLKYKENKAKGRTVKITTTTDILPDAHTSNDGFTAYSSKQNDVLRDIKTQLTASEVHELEYEIWHSLVERGKADIAPSANVKAALSKMSEDDRLLLLQSYVNQLMNRKQIFKLSKEHPDLIFFDTGADVQVLNDDKALSDIQTTTPLIINGATDRATVDKKGDNVLLGEFYIDETFPANIVSMSMQVDGGNHVSYNSDEDIFRVSKGNLSMDFVRYGGLYAAEKQSMLIASGSVHYTSVEDKKKLYSVRQIKAADDALALLNEHCISTRSGIKLFGHAKDFPLTTQDFLRAAVIYGQDCDCFRISTAVLKKPPPLNAHQLLYQPGHSAMYFDIMSTEDTPLKFLASVTQPSEYIQLSIIKSKSTKSVHDAMVKHIRVIEKNKREVIINVSDGEKAVTKIEAVSTLLSRIDIQGGSHVEVVELAQRRIKEKWRGFKGTSGYDIAKLSFLLIAMIIVALAGKLNYPPCESNYNNMSRHTALFGQDVTFKNHLELSPLKPVQVKQPRKDVGYNSSAPRSIDAVALQPMDTLRGAWRFISLETGRLITREQWFTKPLDDSFREKVYRLKPKTSDPSDLDVFVDDGSFFDIDTQFSPQITTVEESRAIDGNIAMPSSSPMQNMYEFRPNEVIPSSQWEYSTPTKPTGSNLLMDFNDEDDAKYIDPVSLLEIERAKPPPPVLSRRKSLRNEIKRQVKLFTPSRIFMSVRQANSKFGSSSVSTVKVNEINQLLNKDVFFPTLYQDMTEKQKKEVIRTTMLVDDKYTPDGNFDKLKARLVGMQYKWLTEMDANDVAAPTVHIQNVLLLATIAAAENREVRVIDVSGAFLNADITSAGQVIILNPESALIACALNPEFKKFVRPNGTMYCVLKKALYGTRTAAKAWFDLVVKTLTADGFIQNYYDKCVFNKMVDGKQITVAFHVDDFFISSENTAAIDAVEALFEKAFHKITRNKGKIINYLGMTFDFSTPGKVGVYQLGYIKTILEENSTTEFASCPADDNLRVTDSNASLLLPTQRDEFHSTVAKLLFLAKRTRPDILLPIQYLTTRVLHADVNDKLKLERVLKYLNSTRNLGLILSSNSPVELLAFIDAAYGVHGDRKSHTGVVASLGTGSILDLTNAQSINTTSSSESELVGLSDGIKPILYIRNFLTAQGYEDLQTTVFQDNMSTIQLVNNGIGNSNKSRHIDIRYFFVTDRLKQGHLRVKHLGTSDMIADILTKPLTGEQFIKLRDLLLGYTTL